MNIQVNTDHNIEGSAELNSFIENNLSEALHRFEGAITRVEVHLSDVNASKTSANDKRCLLEVRLANKKPIVVTNNADTIHQAIEGASGKLLRSLDSIAGKLTKHQSPKDLLVEKDLGLEEE